MPQIFELIREDHDLIRGLFNELESNPETRDVRCITLLRELPGHMYAEEATLYARLRNLEPEEIEQLLGEHTDIREALARFERIPLRDDAWMPGLAGLRERIEAHFRAEEEEVFAWARHRLSRDSLFELSETFQREKGVAARSVAV
jgi:hypothetical protein